MYTIDEFNDLNSKYGSYASWAIWDYKNQSNSSIISQNIDQLHSKYILLGLNISQPLENTPWSNFHRGPSNVRKLKYACNDTKLRGSYITDIFKGIIEPASAKFRSVLTDRIINENVSLFNQEMRDIKISDVSQFIIFGAQNSLLAQCFNAYFKQNHKNQIIYHYHYSYYGLTDKEWVRSLWEKLEIDQDFDSMVGKYRKN